jgi:deaminated glutathione amidase
MDTLFRLAVVSVERPDRDGKMPEVIDHCLSAIDEAAERGADLVLLPEEPDIIAGGGQGEFTQETHPVLRAFSEAAARNKIGLISTLSFLVGERHANTAFLLDRAGECIGCYRKKHPAPTEEAILTDPIISGEPFPVFEFEGVKLGMAICMDIHFPEMFRIYGLKGADVVCMPTMYLDYTGDMLESIEKARAIDSGLYFALSRYITRPFLAGKNMGYAKVIAPDGRVIASTAHRPGVTIADFDPAWRMEFWGEGYGGNMRVMYDSIRRPDFYGALTEEKKES